MAHQTCPEASHAGVEVIKGDKASLLLNLNQFSYYMTWGLKLGRELVQMSSCPGYILESWRPFVGEGAETAGGAALGRTSISLPNLKARINIFAVADCSAGARLKRFQREQLLRDRIGTVPDRICL